MIGLPSLALNTTRSASGKRRLAVSESGAPGMAMEATAGEVTLEADEERLSEFTDVAVDGLGAREGARGTLTVSNRRLLWKEVGGPGEWTVPFLDISLHAVSRDGGDGFPPCVYAQVGEGEVRLIPALESVVERVYEAMCVGAALNVDEVNGEGEGEGELFSREVERFDSMLEVQGNGEAPEDRFQDAEGERET